MIRVLQLSVGTALRACRVSRVAVAAAVVAAVVVVTACAAGGSSSPAGANSAAPAGGSGAPASGKTITIGYDNVESSGNSLPEWRYGGQAAIDYVNAHGGINGAKVNPVYCYVDGSPEASISCAHEFVNDHVALVFVGVDVGLASSLPILSSAGIPVVAADASVTAQDTSPGSFLLSGGYEPEYGALALALKNAGANHLDVIDYSGIGPGADEGYAEVQDLASKLGVTVQQTSVPISDTDWTTTIASALNGSTNGFILPLTEEGCTEALQAMYAASFKGVSDSVCSDYLTALGDNAPATLTTAAVWTPNLAQYAPKSVLQNLTAYENAMRATGQQAYLNSSGASRTFNAVMELGEVLKGINGPVTASSVLTALQGAKNISGYLGPDVHCGTGIVPSEPGVCDTQMMLVRVDRGTSGPKLVPMSNGFIDLAGLAK
jgi:branched-chain amino acid transport system substrate-binding protein